MDKLIVSDIDSHMTPEESCFKEHQIARAEFASANLFAALCLFFCGAWQRHAKHLVIGDIHKSRAIDSACGMAAQAIGCASPLLKMLHQPLRRVIFLL